MKHILYTFAIAALFLTSCGKKGQPKMEEVRTVSDTLTLDQSKLYAFEMLVLRTNLNLERRDKQSRQDFYNGTYKETNAFYFREGGSCYLTVGIAPLGSNGSNAVSVVIEWWDNQKMTFAYYGGETPAVITYPSAYGPDALVYLNRQIERLVPDYKKQTYSPYWD